MTKRIRPEKDVLNDLYSIQRISPKTIAEMYGVNQSTVQKWLRLYEIPRTHLNRPKIKPNEIQLRKWYWKEHWTFPQIASYCGVTHPAVRAWFKKYDIPSRSFSEAQCLYQGTQNITKEVLKELYWEQGMTQSEIGERFGIAQSAIKNKMKKYNVPARGKARYGPANGMFGKTHTAEAIDKISKAAQKQFSNPEARRQRAIISAKIIAEGRTKKSHTKPERVFASILDGLDIDYIWQYRVSRYVYDFYLPAPNILVEVHGTFWHADPRFYDHSNLRPSQNKNIAHDAKKKIFAFRNGFGYLQFWEYDILNAKQFIITKLTSP